MTVLCAASIECTVVPPGLVLLIRGRDIRYSGTAPMLDTVSNRLSEKNNIPSCLGMSPEQPFCKTETKPALRSISIIPARFCLKYVRLLLVVVFTVHGYLHRIGGVFVLFCFFHVIMWITYLFFSFTSESALSSAKPLCL